MPAEAIREVANWLRAQAGSGVPGGHRIAADHALFRSSFPDMLKMLDLHASDVKFGDLVAIMSRFIETL